MTCSCGYLLIVLAWLLGGLTASAQLPQISGKSNPGPKVAVTGPGSSLEDWYRIQYDGKTVGHESVVSVAVSNDKRSRQGTERIRRIRDTRLRLRRFGTDLSVSARLETLESADGLLHNWSLHRTDAEGSVIERTGTWNIDKSGFDITEKIAGTTHRQLLTSPVQPYSPIFPAWLAVDSKNAARLRTVAVMFPETAAIVDIEIRHAGEQSLRDPAGKTIVADRFDYWPTRNPEMKSSVYYETQQTSDGRQAAVRMEQMLAGQTLTLQKTDAALALGQESMEALDLQFSSIMPLKRPLPNIERTESVRLTISVGTSEQIALPSTEFQTVEQTSGNQLRVTLMRPTIPTNSGSQPPPNVGKQNLDPAYTSASRWITSDNDDVKRMGIIAAGGTSILTDKCRRLNRHVWKQMRISPFSTSIQPAATTAKQMRGDCTEHAVLLCALMRSQGIPSRVVIGFVYIPNPASFAPHMWTEAFLDGKWIPFDSTRGPDGIGLTHLKVLDSALSDEVGSGTVLFIPLLNFLGHASVDVAPM